MADIIGYAASLLIGISLGLIGGGGSILTVPVLVYLFGTDPESATAYSLFIVGGTAAVGGVQKLREGFVDVKTALLFGTPSIAAVWLTRKYVVPAIPDPVFGAITKPVFFMGLFAVLMVAASASMIREKKNTGGKENKKEMSAGIKAVLVVLEGLVVGTLTGLVGAGGGFLIIPALVLLAGLDMKKAVGTSLIIIAAKSMIGFTGDLGREIDWHLLLTVTAFAIGGIFIGNKLSQKVDGNKLKKGFGWFVLMMGIYILIKQFTSM
jgi:uncharacterized membrane protein YfcA